ncbi:MAG: hypothetical protein OIF54_11225, partial [Cohaesibacter sp.]|nr:hypothetical protein [Cohaesibacter sp.]
MTGRLFPAVSDGLFHASRNCFASKMALYGLAWCLLSQFFIPVLELLAAGFRLTFEGDRCMEAVSSCAYLPLHARTGASSFFFFFPVMGTPSPSWNVQGWL